MGGGVAGERKKKDKIDSTSKLTLLAQWKPAARRVFPPLVGSRRDATETGNFSLVRLGCLFVCLSVCCPVCFRLKMSRATQQTLRKLSVSICSFYLKCLPSFKKEKITNPKNLIVYFTICSCVSLYLIMWAHFNAANRG